MKKDRFLTKSALNNEENPSSIKGNEHNFEHGIWTCVYARNTKFEFYLVGIS